MCPGYVSPGIAQGLGLRLLLKSTWGSVPTHLRTFHCMPAMIAMLEAGLRDGLHKRDLEHIFSLSCACQSVLMLPYGNHTPAVLTACVSLASTLRKHLCSLTQPAAADSQRQHIAAQNVQLRRLFFESSKLPILLTGHVLAITALESLALVGCREPASTASSSETHTLHHIETLLVVSWLQVCKGWYETKPHVNKLSQWLRETVQELGALRGDLLEVIKLCVQDSLPPVMQRQTWMASCWEQYALSHFHGRLMVGCCSLSCTNLGGVCEAALTTQLCSGCRRARYCSVACQRDAWLGGGHCAVCKT